MSDFFEPGRNCFSAHDAVRAEALIDGQAYFESLVEALEQAQDTIYIAGWAIDAKMWLAPHHERGERIPLELFLRRLVSKRPSLHVYVLIWDFARAMTIGRHPLSIFRRRWLPSRRIHFLFDDAYPFGGCHHQKFVVIDDSVGYCGGIDLTVGRWDTREHLTEDDRRIDQYGHEHGPFHDAQMMVCGEAAESMGAIFRRRWEMVTKKTPRQPEAIREFDLREGPYRFERIDAALARTMPVPEGDPVRENEALFLDMFRTAEDRIYIENQYLTDRQLGVVLAERLGEEDGPEVVVVGPRETANWLEEMTVGLLRWRVIDMLREADAYDRLRIFYPMASVEEDVATYVHIKLLIIDRRFLRIGSANFSSRSLRLDTELDVALECDMSHCDTLERLECDLVAEHFGGIDPEEVAGLLKEHGTLRAVLDELVDRDLDRTLVPLGESPALADRVLAEDSDLLFDPEEPFEIANVFEALVGRQARKRIVDRLPFGFVTLLLTTGVLALWRLYELDDPGALTNIYRIVSSYGATTLGWWSLTAAATVLISSGVAIFFVVLALVVTVGWGQGFVISALAVVISTAVTYGFGRIIDRNLAMKIVGFRTEEVRKRLFRRGSFSVVMLRLAPISKFPTVGVAAGATELPFKSYFVGSLIGTTPVLLILSFIAFGIGDFLHSPNAWSGALMVFSLGAFWLLVRGTSKLFEIRTNRKKRGLPRREGSTR